MNRIFALLLYSLIMLIISTFQTKAQDNDSARTSENFCGAPVPFKPFVVIETWATYSMNETKGNTAYADRFGMQLRRLRFGAKGQAAPRVNYVFMLAADRQGEDPYSATKGSFSGVNLWNACVTAQLLKSSQILNLHAGYFWTAISRETNTLPWAESSFDRTCAVWYLQQFLTAQGNGIESGIALGGMKNFDNRTGIIYRLAVHNPVKHASPAYANPLLSGRVMFCSGDSEQKNYSYMLEGCHWGQRNGITLGLGAAFQGQCDNQKPGADTVFFDQSFAYGADILINKGPWSLDGEYFLMKRQASNYNDFQACETHVRLACCLAAGTHYLEPAFMVSAYSGSGENRLFAWTGTDVMYDVGLNWYLQKEKTKVSLHYVNQNGTTGSNTGDYFGAAFQLML